MYEELHSRKDNELEQRDQKIFGRVVMMAGIAAALIFIAAIVLVGTVGGLIHAVQPAETPPWRVLAQPDRWNG